VLLAPVVKLPPEREDVRIVAQVVIHALQFIEVVAIVSALQPAFSCFKMDKVRE
jgi:hypothetical protein